MKAEPLKIGEKTALIPLVQGGMGVGVSLSGLAGAVAKAGGVGIISSAQIGYRESDFDRNPLEANLRAIKSELQKARAIAPKGIIGFNIMVALKHYDKYVEAAVEAGADLIISGAGIPTELPEFVKDARTMIAPIVSTDKSAKVVLKYWDRKYGRTADMVVIEGPKAGGHLGFSKEQVEQYTDAVYDAEIKAIIQTVEMYGEKYGRHIPVVLAGGISTKEHVAHSFSLGVNGVQVATRFITTEECDADMKYKECFLKAKEKDVVLVKSPVGMPGRAIKNRFMEQVEKEGKVPHSPCHGCLRKCNPTEIPYCITDALIAAARGEVEDGLIFCGAYGYQAERIETVEEVIKSLFEA